MIVDLDAAAFRWVLDHRMPVLDRPIGWLSYFGAFAWMALAFLLGLVIPRRWSAVYQVMLAIGLSTLITDTIVKPLVGRTRPSAFYSDVRVLGAGQTNPSFPSTHASNGFAGAYAVGRAFPAARFAVWPMAIAVSFARVYAGVHYPLDVVVGGFIGLAAAMFVIGGTEWKPGG